MMYNWVRSLLAILLLFVGLMTMAQVNHQINIGPSNSTLEKLLEEITDKSGYYFSYNPDQINPLQVVSFKIQDATIHQVLDHLSSILGIKYTVVQNQIILNQLEEVGQAAPQKIEYFVLSGYVTDAASGEDLIGATVYNQATQIGTQTNEFGFFSLQLPEGSTTIQIGYLGYKTQYIHKQLDRNLSIKIALKLSKIDLPSVIIDVQRDEITLHHDIGPVQINPTQQPLIPDLGGDNGFIRALGAYPGIKTQSDGSAFFFVRGGIKDQNLIIIDDAPIYNPSHLFGFYSLVLPSATRHIKIYKNDMPVQLGDRLSSIIDVRTKDGNLHNFYFGGTLNPLVYQFALEGPIKKEKSSFFASFRRSNFGWLTKASSPDLDINFLDFNLKWNYKINTNNRIYMTIVSGDDALNNQGSLSNNQTGIKWENVSTSVRWNHIFNPKLFSNTTIYTGSYQYLVRSPTDLWHAGLGTLAFKSDFTWYNHPKLQTKFGFEIKGYFFNPGKVLQGDLGSFLPNITPNYTSHTIQYADISGSPSPKWTWHIGYRLSNWANLGPATYYLFSPDQLSHDTIRVPAGTYHSYTRIDPRFALSYLPNQYSAIKFSVGIYHQYLQRISNSTSPFTAFEIWLPAGPNIRPQKTSQWALDYTHILFKQKLQFNAALYYKNLTHQIDYKPHAQLFLNPLVEGELRFGSLTAYGLELMLQKSSGRLNGWITYTFSRAIRHNPSNTSNTVYPAIHDRPHDLSIITNYQLKKRMTLSAFWTSQTGSAFSSPTGYYTYNQSVIPVYGKKHNDRLPNYHRLDVAIKLKLNKNTDQKFNHYLSFSIYNVLAFKNAIDINFNKIQDSNGHPIVPTNVLANQQLIAVQTDLIRFLPSISYKFKL